MMTLISTMAWAIATKTNSLLRRPTLASAEGFNLRQKPIFVVPKKNSTADVLHFFLEF